MTTSFPIRTIELIIPGPQGPAGPEGPSGSFEQSTPANWTTDPNTVQAALDELASRIAALEP